MVKFKVRSSSASVKLCVVILALRQHKAPLTEDNSQWENSSKEFWVSQGFVSGSVLDRRHKAGR